MKKNIKYLILGIIILSIIIVILNVIIFGEVMINMMPNPMDTYERPFFIKVIDEQKGLLPMDIVISTILTALYTLILCKKNILNYNEKNTIYFIIIMIIVSLIIALHIYLKYIVQTVW